jgi:hypothetical protein
MVNKISPKDINLLLNKLIIIIKKIYVSCGNKNKKITVGAGQQGFWSKEKPLEKQINNFLSDDYTNSVSFFQNFHYKYFEEPDKFFIKENINPKNRKNLHSTSVVQYQIEDKINDKINTQIEDKKPEIQMLITNSKNGYYYMESAKLILFRYNNDIKYIVFKIDISKIDEKVILFHIYYFLLNQNIYDNYEKKIDISNLFNIVSRYTKYYEEKIKIEPLNSTHKEDFENIKRDNIIIFYEYIITINNIKNKKKNIDIDLLNYYQNVGGKKDLLILKHAAIYNIGLILQSMKKILNNII